MVTIGLYQKFKTKKSCHFKLLSRSQTTHARRYMSNWISRWAQFLGNRKEFEIGLKWCWWHRHFGDNLSSTLVVTSMRHQHRIWWLESRWYLFGIMLSRALSSKKGFGILNSNFQNCFGLLWGFKNRFTINIFDSYF